MRWLVMAMGLSFAPGTAQHTSLHIAANVVKYEDEVLIPWVDNFLFGTLTMDGMDSLSGRFEEVREAVNMEMKAPDHPPGRTMSCLGMFLDCSSENVLDHFAVLDKKFLETLRGYASQLSSTMTPRDL